MKKIRVIVSGAPGNGKTLVAAAIWDSLSKLGFLTGDQQENEDKDLTLKVLGLRSGNYGSIIPNIYVTVSEVTTNRELN